MPLSGTRYPEGWGALAHVEELGSTGGGAAANWTMLLKSHFEALHKGEWVTWSRFSRAGDVREPSGCKDGDV